MKEDERERVIQQFIEEIRAAEESNDYSEINRKSIENRLGWYEKNKDKLKLEGSDVRKAYTLLIREFMKLKPEEAPIIYEDEKKLFGTHTTGAQF